MFRARFIRISGRKEQKEIDHKQKKSFDLNLTRPLDVAIDWQFPSTCEGYPRSNCHASSSAEELVCLPFGWRRTASSLRFNSKENAIVNKEKAIQSHFVYEATQVY